MTGKPFICNAVWNSITVYPDGKIAPCCIYDYKLARSGENFQGVDTFKDLQQEMLSGSCPQGCRGCWEDEQNGLESYRKNYGDDVGQRDSIKYLDLRNNNTCNLTCRICSPNFSSSWTSLVGDLEFERFNVWPMLEGITNEELTEIYFTGGEPMLNPDHWKLLDTLIENGRSRNISLRYNTNLTTLNYRGKEVTELWKHFKKTRVYASLEAIGEPGQMVRSGLDWDRAEKNIESLLAYRKQRPDTEIFVFCTLGLLNIWFLQELVDWCRDKSITLNTSVLEGPDFLSLSTLPYELKDLLPEIDFAPDRNQNHNRRVYQQARSMIGNTEDLFHHTIAHTLMMDKLRGDRMFDLLPKEVQNFAKRRILLV
jgi:MoaA/NifB/PqqE/SkfB family radical SAM enzyme